MYHKEEVELRSVQIRWIINTLHNHTQSLSMNEFVDTGQEAIRTADGTAEVDERVSTVGHKLYRCQGEIYHGRFVVREYTRKLTIQEEDEPNS